MAIQYNFSDLADLSGAITKAHGAVEGLKSDIKSASGKLQSSWEGGAGMSWSTEQHKWDSACNELTQALHMLAQKVMHSADHMAEVEAKNKGLFSGV